MAKNIVVNYIEESYDELMNKVSWPTFTELQGSAIVVSVASLIIAFLVFLIDIAFRVDLNLFYGRPLDNWGFITGPWVLLIVNTYMVGIVLLVFVSVSKIIKT